MFKNIIKYIFTFVGASIGFALFYIITDFVQKIYNYQLPIKFQIPVLLVLIVSFALLFKVLTPRIIKTSKAIINNIEKESSKFSLYEMLISVFGITIGLIIAYFLSGFTSNLQAFSIPLTILVYLFFTFLGYSLTTRRKDEIRNMLNSYRFDIHKEKTNEKNNKKVTKLDKILDTSVIIDGRILDIALTGFIDGRFIVPKFVLEELQYIADSSDDIKRVKGRRGLDILAEMQSNKLINIDIVDDDFSDIQEVDSKLIKLSSKLEAKVITNDFNLNKVAKLQGVDILNINDLANAVKIIVIPGEEMTISVVREGKEQNQGLGYLDDGTMIVVENGKKFVGQTIDVVVKTVLQTSAGRMIFTRKK